MPAGEVVGFLVWAAADICGPLPQNAIGPRSDIILPPTLDAMVRMHPEANHLAWTTLGIGYVAALPISAGDNGLTCRGACP